MELPEVQRPHGMKPSKTYEKHGIYAVTLHRISVGRFTLVSSLRFSGTQKIFGLIADGYLVLFFYFKFYILRYYCSPEYRLAEGW